jgi:hypothetical protein
MRVIDIKTRARAREEAQAARAHAMQERSSREVEAMVANRKARISNMRKAWLLRMASCTVGALIVGGLGGFLIGQGTASLPVAHFGSTDNDLALKIPRDISTEITQKAIEGNPEITATTSPISTLTVVKRELDIPSKALPSVRSVAKATSSTPTPIGSGKANIDMNRAPPSGTSNAVTLVTGARTERQVNGVFEAPALVQQPLQNTKSSNQSTATLGVTGTSTRATGFKPVNVAIDGVLMIQVGSDPTIRNVRVGERLPSGEVLRSAIADSGAVETSERSFTVR